MSYNSGTSLINYVSEYIGYTSGSQTFFSRRPLKTSQYSRRRNEKKVFSSITSLNNLFFSETHSVL